MTVMQQKKIGKKIRKSHQQKKGKGCENYVVPNEKPHEK